MKKKILSLILAVVLFIPMNIVKASDITIDQIIERLNQNIASGDSFLSKKGAATAQKLDSDTIRVYVSADPDDFYNNFEGNSENFRFFTEYRYENSTLSTNHMATCGVTDGNTIDMFEDSDIEEIDVLDSYINAAYKDMVYVAYNIKTNNSYEYIHNYLVEAGVETQEGNAHNYIPNPPNGFTVQEVLDEEITQINLDEIDMLPNEGANQTNPRLVSVSQSTDQQEFIINYKEEANVVWFFDVTSFNKTYQAAKDNNASEALLDNYADLENSVKELLKENGSFIDMYQILLYRTENNLSITKTDGPFEFKIKATDELKKYDSLKLVSVNLETSTPTKNEIVELTKDGDYYVGTLPHLSVYALVGTNTTVENPKTGVSTYGTAGLIAIIALGGSYMVFKKKMSN